MRVDDIQTGMLVVHDDMPRSVYRVITLPEDRRSAFYRPTVQIDWVSGYHNDPPTWGAWVSKLRLAIPAHVCLPEGM